MIKYFNVRPEIIKFLEENICGKFLDISVSDLFIFSPKAKIRNKQMGVYQTKNLLHRK